MPGSLGSIPATARPTFAHEGDFNFTWGFHRNFDLTVLVPIVTNHFEFETMMDTEDPLSFARRKRVRYPLAVASDELKQKFGSIEGLPTTMLYDRQGVLRKKIVGF